MANKISITLDYSEKFLDKQRDIANNDGIKRTVDGFRVVGMAGKGVNVIFIALIDGVWSKEERRTIYKHISVMEKLKRVKYIDGKMIINICGDDYCIGNYTEVE